MTTTIAGHKTDVLPFTISHDRAPLENDPNFYVDTLPEIADGDQVFAFGTLDNDADCHVECSLEIKGDLYLEAHFDNKGWNPT